jgi:hypothetical protein
MPAGLEQAREVVRWTEQVAREADHAKAKFYGQYQPGNRPAVVVTGANGLLGSAFVKRLIDEDEYIRCLCGVCLRRKSRSSADRGCPR